MKSEGRNNALTSIAGRLRVQGLDEEEILIELLRHPDRQSLPEAEVRAIAKSVARYPKGEPPRGSPAVTSGGGHQPAPILLPNPILPPHPPLRHSAPPLPGPLERLASIRGWSLDAFAALGAKAEGERVTLPMRDAEGKVTGQKQRRGDNEMIGAGDSAHKSHTIKGSRNGLFYPHPLPETDLTMIVEGEADTLAALSAGCSAVVGTAGANPGKTGEEALQQLLAGRKVVLTPDPGQAGQDWLNKVGSVLHGVQCEVHYIPPDAKLDLDARLKVAPDKAAELKRLIKLAILWKPTAAGTEKPGKQADVLVGLAEDAELFHGPGSDEGYATISMGSHRETWPLRSRGFRRWLSQRFYLKEKKAPNTQALDDAIAVLEGQAVFEGAEHQVWMRVAEHTGRIYIDLADARWRAVEVTPDGWRVIEQPEVRFLRRESMLPLPEPVRGGKVDEFWEYVNVPDAHQRVLVLSWMVAALRPSGPYPLLAVNGEQGSAKSTLTRMVRGLIDPNKAPLRRPPQKEHDLMITAQNQWALALDNLSGLPGWLSDALCCLATGGGLAVRELYTDDAEKIFDARRPVILNGIEDLNARPDLLDRTISLTLPRIDDERRMTEKNLHERYESARPRILGALFDALVVGLQRVDQVKLENLPRMADFAVWAVACEPGLGLEDGAFIAAYCGNQDASTELAIESSIIGQPLLDFMNRWSDSWVGTAQELLAELRKLADEDVVRNNRWPATPRAMSGQLRRLAPNLRRVNIEVILDRRTTDSDRRRLIELRRRRDQSASSLPTPAATAQMQSDGPDGPDGVFFNSEAEREVVEI